MEENQTKDTKIYARILVNFLLTVAGVLLVFFLLPKLLRFFLPFVIAFLISAIANPVVRFMEKKIKIVRKTSSAIMIVLVLGAVVGVLYLVIRFLVNQVENLYTDRYAIYTEVSQVLEQFTGRLEGLFELLPGDTQVSLSSLKESLTVWVENFLKGIELPSLSAAGGYVGSVVEVVFIAIITILAAYFLTAEHDNIASRLRNTMPKAVITCYDMVVATFKHAVGGYFKAQFKIMLILIGVMWIGFLILNVRYGLLLATLIAALDFLPVFGTGAVFWPWIVVDVIVGDYKEAIFLGILYLVCQLIKQLLQPKMVGDSVGMNPLATLLYMFVGYRLGGVLGMIIGIPVGMILVSFYKAGMFDQIIKGVKILAGAVNDFRKY
ncbi:MAG: sporulation integral membrane protein YtvI [Lachnospiraceae bacterium]|nr:sporulation integral membrane protein YtvI [Lachnospiraceae bacterium]